MRVLKILVILLLSFHTVCSQDSKRDRKIDSLIYEISINISSTNPTRAHHLADSLFLYAPSAHYKIKALLLNTEIYKMEERTQDMLESLLQALTFSKEIQDYNSQAKIYGYLASISRETGFYDEGKHYLQKGIETIHKTQEPAAIEIYQAIANQEMAELELEMGNFLEANRFLDLSSEYYNAHKQNDRALYLLSRIEQIKGKSFMGLEDYDKALNEFHKARNNLQKSGAKNSLIWALLYQSLGDVYLIQQQKDSAYFYLSKALAIAEPSSHNSFKEEIYGSLSQYFREVENADSMAVYTKKHQETARTNKQSKKYTVNNLTQSLPPKTPFLENQNTKQWWIVGGGLLFIFGGVIVLATPSIRTKLLTANKKDSDKNIINISKNSEKKITERLIMFERSQKYLNPNMNFSTLVSFLDTNSKYLNQHLKTKLQKDYNTYINDLRIHYITQRITNNKRYRQYKISHLAKESGFSSHSNFSANFKRVTGISPSQYIEKINAEINESTD